MERGVSKSPAFHLELQAHRATMVQTKTGAQQNEWLTFLRQRRAEYHAHKASLPPKERPKKKRRVKGRDRTEPEHSSSLMLEPRSGAGTLLVYAECSDTLSPASDMPLSGGVCVRTRLNVPLKLYQNEQALSIGHPYESVQGDDADTRGCQSVRPDWGMVSDSGCPSQRKCGTDHEGTQEAANETSSGQMWGRDTAPLRS